MLNLLENDRVLDITLALGAELLVSAKIANDIPSARVKLERALSAGAAADHFDRMVFALGGPTNFLTTHGKHLPHAAIVKPVYADDEGQVTAMKTRNLGLAVIELGGGRRVATDKINHAVGLSNLLGKGFRADFETPLCMIHAQSEADFEKAAVLVKSAYSLGEHGASGPNIIERIAP